MVPLGARLVWAGIRPVQAGTCSVQPGERSVQAEIRSVRLGARGAQPGARSVQAEIRLARAEIRSVRLGARGAQPGARSVQAEIRLARAEIRLVRAGARSVRPEAFSVPTRRTRSNRGSPSLKQPRVRGHSLSVRFTCRQSRPQQQRGDNYSGAGRAAYSLWEYVFLCEAIFGVGCQTDNASHLMRY